MKKLVFFDLDGTLTESKLPIDEEMAGLLGDLLTNKMVGVIGGGSLEQFNIQLLKNLKCKDKFSNLLLFPTNGAFYYRYENGEWKEKYSKLLSVEQKEKIYNAFETAFEEINYKNPEKIFGPVLEDRDSQITFSALGQKAPIEKRNEWRKNCDRRQEIKRVLDKYLPEFEVVVAGVTSIDVIQKGVNKGAAIDYAQKVFNVPDKEAVFVGDALFKGGNDYSAREAKVETIKVEGPEETKKLIKDWL